MDDIEKKLQERTRANGKGQSGDDIAMEKMKNKDSAAINVIESSKANDRITNELRQEAETTIGAYKILQELEKNPKIQTSIKQISGEIGELYIKKYFNCSSPHQSKVDGYVKQTLLDMKEKQKIAKVVAQIATDIAKGTMENIDKDIAKEDNER